MGFLVPVPVLSKETKGAWSLQKEGWDTVHTITAKLHLTTPHSSPSSSHFTPFPLLQLSYILQWVQVKVDSGQSDVPPLVTALSKCPPRGREDCGCHFKKSAQIHWHKPLLTTAQSRILGYLSNNNSNEHRCVPDSVILNTSILKDFNQSFNPSHKIGIVNSMT